MSSMNREYVPPIGAVLDGQYRLVSAPIRQDLGLLLQAQDLEQDRPVEILLLSRNWGSGVSALNRVEAAQQAIVGLRNSALPPFESFGLLDGQLYLVRKRSEGLTLADLLASSDGLAAQDALELAIQLCEALSPAHKAGLVHGSLSPHAIRVRETENGAWKVILLDTGLLPALFPAEVSQGRPWGRAPYLSPEQAAGKQATTMSDVYVLGSLLYEMISGRPPFRSKDESVLAFQHMRQQHPSLQVLAPNAPQVLVQIVNQALAKEPPTRYRNAGQLGHVLRTQLRRPQAVPLQDQVPAERSPIRERLMVPAPETTPATSWSASQAYEPEGTDAWSDEQTGVDWLMVGLIIAAMIAVLGLIPLWRAVYRRYAAPLPSTASFSESSLAAASAWTAQGTEEWAGMQYLLAQSIAASHKGSPLSSSQSRSLGTSHATVKWQAIGDGMLTSYSRAPAVTPGTELPVYELAVDLSMFRFGVQLTGFGQKA